MTLIYEWIMVDVMMFVTHTIIVQRKRENMTLVEYCIVFLTLVWVNMIYNV